MHGALLLVSRVAVRGPGRDAFGALLPLRVGAYVERGGGRGAQRRAPGEAVVMVAWWKRWKPQKRSLWTLEDALVLRQRQMSLYGAVDLGEEPTRILAAWDRLGGAR